MYNNNIITAPVSIYDVQLALSTSQKDLGTLCQLAAINKWAKYKPVAKAAIVRALTDAERASVNYGIANIPTWDNINKMITFWLLEDRTSATNYPECGLKTEYWAYQIPTGTLSAPFRMTDYAKNTTVGYFHMAEAPIGPIVNTNLQITPNGQLVMVWPTGAQDEKTLKYTDLMYYDGSQISLSGFYFTAILVRANATTTKYVMTDENQSAQDTLTDGAHCRPWFQDLAAVNAFLGNAESAQFYCMCCLCNQEIYDTFSATSGGTTTYYRKFLTSLGSLTADKFVALFARQTVTISKQYAEITMSTVAAWKNSSLSTRLVYYSLVLTNTESDVQRYYKLTVELLASDDSVINTIIQRDNIAGGGSVTISSSIDASEYYSAAAKLRVTTELPAEYNTAILVKTNTETVIVSSIPPQ